MQVYFLPTKVDVEPAFEQTLPALGAAMALVGMSIANASTSTIHRLFMR